MAKPETLMIDDTKYIRADAAQPTVSYVAGTKWGWEIGKRYFIRTVTMHLHGLLIDIDEYEITLTNAAWIADSGRFFDFITGKKQPNEVEPFNPVAIVKVGRGALVDATQLDQKFEAQK